MEKKQTITVSIMTPRYGSRKGEKFIIPVDKSSDEILQSEFSNSNLFEVYDEDEDGIPLEGIPFSLMVLETFMDYWHVKFIK